MNILSRIFARTPSLRTRVVIATAIGAAIPVLIVGVVVWVGITNAGIGTLEPLKSSGASSFLLLIEKYPRSAITSSEIADSFNCNR